MCVGRAPGRCAGPFPSSLVSSLAFTLLRPLSSVRPCALPRVLPLPSIGGKLPSNLKSGLVRAQNSVT